MIWWDNLHCIDKSVLEETPALNFGRVVSFLTVVGGIQGHSFPPPGARWLVQKPSGAWRVVHLDWRAHCAPELRLVVTVGATT